MPDENGKPTLEDLGRNIKRDQDEGIISKLKRRVAEGMSGFSKADPKPSPSPTGYDKE